MSMFYILYKLYGIIVHAYYNKLHIKYERSCVCFKLCAAFLPATSIHALTPSGCLNSNAIHKH